MTLQEILKRIENVLYQGVDTESQDLDSLRYDLERKIIKKGEMMNKKEKKELLYGFIDFYTTRDIDKLDLRILADRYVEEGDNGKD
tara:strand:- start:1646 stop:1903 length:258 start_codon:yes stop_codon:yes gene_type:complete